MLSGSLIPFTKTCEYYEGRNDYGCKSVRELGRKSSETNPIGRDNYLSLGREWDATLDIRAINSPARETND